MVSLYMYFFPLLPQYALTAAEADVMALLSSIRLNLKQILQSKAAVKLASVGLNGDSEQQASQVK